MYVYEVYKRLERDFCRQDGIASGGRCRGVGSRRQLWKETQSQKRVYNEKTSKSNREDKREMENEVESTSGVHDLHHGDHILESRDKSV